MYYRAQDLALNNGHAYHIAAILMRKKVVVRIGVNSDKTHPIATRSYPTGKPAHQLHAEMDALRFARPGDKLIVVRFLNSGELAIAKPCEHCQRLIKEKGISLVEYSDINGDMKRYNP